MLKPSPLTLGQGLVAIVELGSQLGWLRLVSLADSRQVPDFFERSRFCTDIESTITAAHQPDTEAAASILRRSIIMIIC